MAGSAVDLPCGTWSFSLRVLCATRRQRKMRSLETTFMMFLKTVGKPLSPPLQPASVTGFQSRKLWSCGLAESSQGRLGWSHIGVRPWGIFLQFTVFVVSDCCHLCPLCYCWTSLLHGCYQVQGHKLGCDVKVFFRVCLEMRVPHIGTMGCRNHHHPRVPAPRGRAKTTLRTDTPLPIVSCRAWVL